MKNDWTFGDVVDSVVSMQNRVAHLERMLCGAETEPQKIERIPQNLDAAARLAGAWSTVYSAAVSELNSAALSFRGDTAAGRQGQYHRNLERHANTAFAELSKISEVMMYPDTIFKVEETKDAE